MTDFAFVPSITISGQISIRANFASDSVKYLDDELHVRDRKLNEYKVSFVLIKINSAQFQHVMRYLGLLNADPEEYFERFNGSQADMFTFVSGADEAQIVNTSELKVS